MKQYTFAADMKYIREGDDLVRREHGGTYRITLPDRSFATLGYWIKPSPFPGTPPWEWVITNIPATLVTGMTSGYTHTRWGARRAVQRALNFWQSLGYETSML